MRAYALAARADLEAEVERLQAALASAQRLKEAYKVAPNVGDYPEQIAQRDKRIRELEQETVAQGNLIRELDGIGAKLEAAEARVKELEHQLELAQHDSVSQSQLYAEYIEEWTKERNDLRKLVAELQERLMVLCVAQINEAEDEPVPLVDSGLDERRYRLVADTEIEFSVPDGDERETLKAGTYVWLARWTDDQLELARHRAQKLHRKLHAAPLRPSPASPAPAPLAAQGVEGEPHHER
jgi:DNA repair exonuclease SbcCD ATPase subunit